MFYLRFVLSMGVATLFLASCTSDLKVNEFNSSTDPQSELVRIDSNIDQAQRNQVNILSPKYFEEAKAARKKAVEQRAENKKQKDILHSLALAQANLDKATEMAKVSNVLLKGPIEARQDAIDAKAYSLFQKEFETADKNFKSLTEQVEDNDTANVDRKRGQIEASYRDLELKSIKKDKLGAAKDTMSEAVKEGAEKLTPETLSVTSKKYSESEAIIENQRHDTLAVNKASEEAVISANRLLKMVRDAKGSSTKKPEELAKQIETNELAAIKSKKLLKKSETALANSDSNLANAAQRNSKLESQVWLDKEFEKARKEFNSTEAEVYKQGDKLLLRLKGLSFANNKAAIDSANFGLLAKVQKVISDLNAKQIEIEGHTDSRGGKKLNDILSAKRAESVQSYLIANNNVDPNNITSAGYGDSKPIATNKTAEGRAQNRRVDVIITANENK